MKKFFSDDTFFIRNVCYAIGIATLTAFAYVIFS